DQIRIETIKPLKTTINNNVKFDEDKRYIVANINNTRAVFDKIKGVFSSICCDNKEYFVAPMQYNIWRAPTDNDNGIKEQWLRAGYNRAFTKMYSCKIIDSCIVVKFSMVSNANRPIMDIVAEYSFDEDGRLHGNIKCIRNKEMVFLPRFGIRLFLDYHMENATYTGYGAGESYIDKCQNSYFGKFSATADEMFTDYIIPQENGARYGVEKLLITGEKKSMSFLAEKPYSFNLSHYTQEELFKKGHNFELNKSNYTILCFDYFNSGIGSGSCCTTLDSKYQLDDETFEFNFYLKVK
ncbi:MAG: beta-galactosidase small subunit, partial [Oscillospiraceae bacterium]